MEFDRILSRYSWSIEYLMGVKYSRYFKIRNAAFSNISRESLDAFFPPAFQFWLENMQGNSTSSMTFDKMCRELGLIDAPKKSSKASSKLEAQKAIERASKIIELDKKRHKHERI